MSISKVIDLNVYKIAFDLAMDIFSVSIKFPREEKYSLTDQIRGHPGLWRLILEKAGVKELINLCLNAT